MPTTLSLAVLASLLLPVQAVKQPPTAPPANCKALQGADLMWGA